MFQVCYLKSSAKLEMLGESPASLSTTNPLLPHPVLPRQNIIPTEPVMVGPVMELLRASHLKAKIQSNLLNQVCLSINQLCQGLALDYLQLRLWYLILPQPSKAPLYFGMCSVCSGWFFGESQAYLFFRL